MKNSSSLSSQSPALRSSSALLTLLVSFLKIACLHVSFRAYENFYKISKMHCHLVLTFHFLILRMSEYRYPTIKHISTYTLVSSFINTYVTDLFLFHIVKSLSESMGLSKCESTHLPNYISARQSVCLSLPDLGFNILLVDSYFDQVLGSSHYPHLPCPTPTSFGDY